MSDTAPTELIVSAFRTENGADEALSDLLLAKRVQLVKLHAAATVRRDSAGKLHIKERGDVGTGKGAASGAALGAVIGIFGGPIGMALGGAAGAAIGGLAARLVDTGIPDARLEQIGSALTNGSSAIVALIEFSIVDEVRTELRRAGGDLMAQAITADIAAQLAAGKDVAYSALSGSQGAVVTRTTGDEHSIDVHGVAASAEGGVAGFIAKVRTAAGDAVDSAKETIEHAVDATKDAAADAKDAAGDVVDATKHAAADAKDAASDAVDATKDAAKDVKDAAGDAVDSAKETIEHAVDATKDAAADAVDATKDAAKDTADAAKRALS